MRHGWGRHIVELNMTDLMLFNEALLPNTLTYLITPAVTKMAILVVLFRINPSTVYRVCVVTIGVAIFAYTLVLTTITGGPCSPLKQGTLPCLMNVALAQAVLNIASDLAVVAAPIPTILGLQLSKKQKATVSCILALGSGYALSLSTPRLLLSLGLLIPPAESSSAPSRACHTSTRWPTTPTRPTRRLFSACGPSLRSTSALSAVQQCG